MNMKRSILVGVVLASLLGLVQDGVCAFDPNLPADFPELDIFWTEEAAPGVLIGNLGKRSGYRVVLDNEGYPLHYSKEKEFVSKNVVSNGLIAYVHRDLNRFYLKDESFTVVDSFAGTNDRCFVMLPNGHAIVAVGDSRQMDLSQIIPGGRPDADVKDGGFLEMNANKEVVFEWYCLDHIPITETLADLTDQSVDFTHLNYVNIDPIDHNYLISLRSICGIYKISRTTGEIIWRLGGPANDFTFIGEHEENAPYYFVGQHSVHRLTDGNILFFDNGGAGGHVDVPVRSYSRAVEYHLDESTRTATLVWEYRRDPDIYAGSGGDVQRFDNGNTLLNWGSATRNTAIVMTEATPAGEVAFELAFSDRDATYDKCIMLKQMWNSPDLVRSQTHFNVENGQTYDSSSTGVSVTVNSLAASPDYHGLVVKKHDVAVRFPKFSGKAPWILKKRVTLAGFAISSIDLDATFGATDLDFNDPCELTVYHRPYVGQGEFSALVTTYDDANETLAVAGTTLGEFVFGYPDAAEIPLAPSLTAPEDAGTVNEEQPVAFEWHPNGFFRSYALQVATDAYFNSLIVDESGLEQSNYELASVDPCTTYYWRANTTNLGGTSDWATRSFTTVPPMIAVVSPDANDSWQQGLDYFIQWQDNLSEDVVIELYKGGELALTIDTVASTGAFEWEVALELESGCDYTIKIISALDESISGISEEFTIGPLGDFNCDGIVDPNDLSLLTADWLEEHAELITDLDGSGEVDFDDFSMFANSWMNPGPK